MKEVLRVPRCFQLHFLQPEDYSSRVMLDLCFLYILKNYHLRPSDFVIHQHFQNFSLEIFLIYHLSVILHLYQSCHDLWVSSSFMVPLSRPLSLPEARPPRSILNLPKLADLTLASQINL
jgi:hypothetical protein